MSRLRDAIALVLLCATFVTAGQVSQPPIDITNATLTGTSVTLGSTDTAGQGVYLTSGFKSGTEQLYLWGSVDGKTWGLLSPASIYTPATGSLRDPSIMYYQNKFWVAHTINGGGASTAFEIASSPDLINWTLVGSISTGVSGANRVWSPEWFIDSDGTVHIVCAVSADGGTTFKLYVLDAQNAALSSWSSATDLGLGTNKIDPFVIKVGGTYYVWYQNFATTYIEYASSSSLKTGYTVQQTGDWAGWGSGLEGPSLVLTQSGTYRIYFDKYTAQGIYYSESTDTFSTWTAKALVAEPFPASHTTTIRSLDLNVLRSVTAAAIQQLARGRLWISGSTPDIVFANQTILKECAANVLCMQNSTSNQEWRVYGTISGSDSEYLFMNAAGANVDIGHYKTGSGTYRALGLHAGGSRRVTVNTDGTVDLANLTTTGSAGGKKVVCVDTATGKLYASSTGVDCSN